jgi:hypothetical protein
MLLPHAPTERILARVQEIVGRAAERAEISLERILRGLAAIAFSDICKVVTWGPSAQVRGEKGNDGKRVTVVTSAVSLMLRDKINENTAVAIAAVSQSSTGTLSVKMHRWGPVRAAAGGTLTLGGPGLPGFFCPPRDYVEPYRRDEPLLSLKVL